MLYSESYEHKDKARGEKQRLRKRRKSSIRVVIAQIGRARHCECKGHGFDPR